MVGFKGFPKRSLERQKRFFFTPLIQRRANLRLRLEQKELGACPQQK